MDQVTVYTLGEEVRAVRGGTVIEFLRSNAGPFVNWELSHLHPTYEPILTERTVAPIHLICEYGKPDVLIAIEPKLYDLFIDIKIKEFADNLEHERRVIQSLSNNLENTRSALGEMNKLVHEFNNLPWWKRAYLAITKGV